ncbi:hypothetical protein OAT06_04120 [Nitrospinaceae bacterium]|nr:hypothetical protein [Nitrospinaceae bacterium]
MKKTDCPMIEYLPASFLPFFEIPCQEPACFEFVTPAKTQSIEIIESKKQKRIFIQ